MQKLNWSASESTLSTSPVATNVENINTLRNLKKTFKTAKNLFSVFLCVYAHTHTCVHTWTDVFFCCRCSVAQSCLTHWEPHGLQHARLPCPSPPPGACSDSCPSSNWCHPTISSSVIPFSCPQSFPASGSFLMSQFFASGDQSIGTLASILPMNIQDWFPLEVTGLIPLQTL